MINKILELREQMMKDFRICSGLEGKGELKPIGREKTCEMIKNFDEHVLGPYLCNSKAIEELAKELEFYKN